MKVPGGTETILVVDDEPEERKVIRRTLEGIGYTVLDVASPESAVILAQDPARTIDLLLTDLVMPEMHGRALVERLVALRPTLKVLYVTGYSEDVLVSYGVDISKALCLYKPFDRAALADKVRQALDRS